ncbi:hypothetical protein Moror_12717 [Moniliophthora roreri MCA 2997]|uniref:Uncharacterized protein n=2 Tax=Moniliophthora roreri TaxID=221103 RepID=V2XRN8_MONRO|nr:hypothetical protein Moror_12717 [Moniliophthora roreri MCA 2997]KAI3615668.1 hypothetical protein WG66_011767 [Moniliophthora roreri]
MSTKSMSPTDRHPPPEDRDVADHYEVEVEVEEDEERRRLSAVSKGKQREASSSTEDDETTPETAYPPGNDEAVETRRIEENLRRWEVAERLRRKAARGSVASNTTSIVSEVGRRASLLWRGPSQSRHRALGGDHTALHSQDSMDHLPMDNMIQSPGLSPRQSSTITPPSPSTPGTTIENDPRNPFANPPEQLSSPFADSYQATALMSPTTDTPPISRSTSDSAPQRPTLEASSSFTSKPPPPRPLGLPPPRTPPPIDEPPQTTPPPTLHPDDEENLTEEKETRWWHEILCGCGEGRDRGGDYQAGRTNPNE